MLATDALITRRRRAGRRSIPRRSTRSNELLPPHWSHSNPIDILGDAGPSDMRKALEIAAKDPNSDGLLVILTPQAMTDPTRTAEQLEAVRQDRRQAGARELDGRRRTCAAGESDPERARHPDVRLPRHRRAGVQLHVAVQRQPAGAVRDADALPSGPAKRPDRAAAEQIIAARRATRAGRC